MTKTARPWAGVALPVQNEPWKALEENGQNGQSKEAKETKPGHRITGTDPRRALKRQKSLPEQVLDTKVLVARTGFFGALVGKQSCFGFQAGPGVFEKMETSNY